MSVLKMKKWRQREVKKLVQKVAELEIQAGHSLSRAWVTKLVQVQG